MDVLRNITMNITDPGHHKRLEWVQNQWIQEKETTTQAASHGVLEHQTQGIIGG